MIATRALFCVALALVGHSAVAQVPPTTKRIVDERFDGEALNTQLWCPCQMQMTGDSRLHFHKELGNGVARIAALESNIGGNECDRASECKPILGVIAESSAFGFTSAPLLAEDAEPVEKLGPSLLFKPKSLSLPELKFEGAVPTLTFPSVGEKESAAAAPAGEKPFCDDARKAEGASKGNINESPCTQRQELRLQKDKIHPYGKALLYSFRFRMEKSVPDEAKSIRWVTAQWKQEPAVEPEGNLDKPWSPSPFLSQRFDDGVLHIAVQDKDCRCLVASAPDLRNPEWATRPTRCYATANGAVAEGEKCPADLETFYGKGPLLPTARGEWAILRYLVKPGRKGTGEIQVFDDDRLIVKVKGSIGYDEPAKKSVVKFKIGHYNDFIPGIHMMDVDWLRIDEVD